MGTYIRNEDGVSIEAEQLNRTRLNPVGDTVEQGEAGDYLVQTPDGPRITGRLRFEEGHTPAGDGSQDNDAAEGNNVDGVTSESPDLSKLTNAELHAIAEDEGLELPKGAKKAELVAAIEEHRASASEDSQEGHSEDGDDPNAQVSPDDGGDTQEGHSSSTDAPSA